MLYGISSNNFSITSTLALLFLLALFPSFLLAQHSIKGVFTPADEFEFVILYEVTPTTSIYVNNAEIDAEGKFEFKLDSTYTKGMYRIVYTAPQDVYNFDFIYNTEQSLLFIYARNRCLWIDLLFLY